MSIDEIRRQIIVVLGMHRSGTSAITRGLTALGVDLGENLISPEPDNPDGFWEDRDIAGLNMEFLKQLGHDLYHSSLIPIRESLLDSERIAVFKFQAIELLRKKTAAYPIFGIKDPRTARLLSFWQEIYVHLGLDVRYVIAVRNPLSVARSMRARNKFEPEKSYYLWLEHLVPAVLKTSSAQRVFVNYDSLMDDPVKELQRIALSLALPADRNQNRLVQEYRDLFLKNHLRHSRYMTEDLSLDPSVPRPVIDAFEILVKLCSDNLSPSTEEVT
ncbi:MAG: sulfotransferase family protein, partial [Methylococcales bacterium]